MTGPDTENTRPISVAELLAKNGTIGSPPVTARRRRKRGKGNAVSVAELTGEIPIISDDEPASDPDAAPEQDGPAQDVFEADEVTEPEPDRPVTVAAAVDRLETVGWSESEPRWPQSPRPRSSSGPELSHYPRPVRRADLQDAGRDEPVGGAASDFGAEQMSPDPESAAPTLEHLRDVRDDHRTDGETDVIDALPEEHGRGHGLLASGLIVLQSILAVLFGAGLFIAFDQLWRWNDIVALVLTVLVTLGLVTSVQAVRKTVDIPSTLIAVAVGLLITLGPLALHAT
jgi:hypothetical protein